MARFLSHLTSTRWHLRRAFPPRTLEAIHHCIHEEESRHRGEIRFAVETCMELQWLVAGLTPGQRARDVFSHLRVWDTEENTGVLIYVLLAERHMEIVADRGFRDRIKPGDWAAVCRDMEQEFRAGRFEDGALTAIRRVSALIGSHYPPGPRNENELPDAPVLLR